MIPADNIKFQNRGAKAIGIQKFPSKILFFIFYFFLKFKQKKIINKMKNLHFTSLVPKIDATNSNIVKDKEGITAKIPIKSKYPGKNNFILHFFY